MSDYVKLEQDVAKMRAAFEGNPYATPPVQSIPQILLQVSGELKQLHDARVLYEARITTLENTKREWLKYAAGAAVVITTGAVVVSKVVDWVIASVPHKP